MGAANHGAPPPPFGCDVLEPNGEVLLVVRGEIDVATVGRLDQYLDYGIQRNKDVFLDLAEASMVDGRGLRSIFRAARHVAGRGHKVTVATASPLLSRLLQTAPNAPEVPVVLIR